MAKKINIIRHSIVFCFFLITGIGSAQEFKPGKIDNSWFEKPLTEEQSNASAVYLEKYRRTHFEYRDNLDGWTLFTTIHNVIKIQDTEGLSHANKTIRLFNEGREDEKIDNIEAYAYTLNGAKVERFKMKNNQVLNTKRNKYLDEISLVIPNAIVGGIIEYTYRIESTFWNIEDVVVQEDIPVKHAYAKIEIPQFFDYNKFIIGYLHIDAKLSEEERSENFTAEAKNPYGGKIANRTNFANIKYKQTVSEYEFNDIPAIVEESYMNNVNNYRAAVVYELAAVEFQTGKKISRSKTWNEVANFFFENLELGKDLEETSFLTEDILRIKENTTGNSQKIKAAYKMIQEKFTWDKDETYFRSPNLGNAYKEGVGSSYEINMTLVALLKRLGLKSSPIMASTKDNGIPIYPTVEGFNYVLAGVLLNNTWIVLDATEKNAPLGLLPERVMNWEGRLVQQDGESQSIPLFANSYSEKKSLVMASIQDNGAVEGKMRRLYSNNAGLELLNSYKDLAPKSQLYQLSNDFVVENINDAKFKFGDLSKPASVTFGFNDKNFVEELSDKLYVEPQLFFQKRENPFNGDERIYPIDFRYPSSTENIVTLTIPDGYKVESLPSDIELTLPDGLGVYRFTCKSVNDTSVQTLSTLTLSETLVSADYYKELKDFYSQILAKEKETLVLEKI